MAVTLGDLLVYIRGDKGPLDKEIDGAERRVKGFGEKASGFIRDSMTHAVGSLVSTGINKAVTAVEGFIGTAVDQAGDYQQALNITRAAAKGAGEDITKLDELMQQVRERATELGKDSTLPAVTSADAAETIAELVKGNLSLAQAIEAAKGTLQLSTAAQTDHANAAQVTAGALNMFKLKGEDAITVADLLAASSNNSIASMTDLAVGLRQGGFAFGATGQSIQDFITALTIMTNAGLTGSDSGTALKNAMMKLMAPTKEGRAAMNDFGISVFDASGKMLPFPAILKQFNDKMKEGSVIAVKVGGATKGQTKELESLDKSIEKYVAVANDATKSDKVRANATNKVAEAAAQYAKVTGEIVPAGTKMVKVTEQMKLQAMEAIFLSDGMKALLPLMDQGNEGWDAMYKKVTAANAAQEMAEAKTKGTKGAFEALKSTLETVGQKLMEPFVGTDVKVGIFETAIKRVTDLAGAIPAEAIAEKLGKIIEILFSPYEDGGLLGALEELGVEPATIDTLYDLGQTAMTFFGWVQTNGYEIATIIGGIVGAILLFQTISGVVGAITTVTAVVGALGATFTAAGGGAAGLVAILGGPVTVVIGLVVAAIALLFVAWTNNWGGIQEKTATAAAWIQARLDEFVLWLTGLWNTYGDDVTRIWNDIWTKGQEIFDGAVTNLQTTLDLFTLAWNGDWEQLGYEIGRIWGVAWEDVKGAFNTAKSDLTAKSQQLASDIVAKFKNTDWSAVGRDIIEGVGRGIDSLAGWLSEKARNMANAALAAARQAIADFKAFVAGASDGFNDATQQNTTGSGTGTGTSSGAGLPPPGTPKLPGGTPQGFSRGAASIAGTGSIVVQFNNVTINKDFDLDVLAGQVASKIRGAMAS
jgi:TP901 family phage tail tape measure protein